MAPSNGAGPTCCGISTTWWRSTPRTPRWPSGPAAVHQRLCRGRRSFTHPQAQRRRTAQRGRWEQAAAESIGQPFLADPLATAGRGCAGRIERHIKELFVFVAEPDVPSDNNPAERSLRHLGYQPQGQRRHPVGAGHREQDDAGIGSSAPGALTRPEPPRRLHANCSLSHSGSEGVLRVGLPKQMGTCLAAPTVRGLMARRSPQV